VDQNLVFMQLDSAFAAAIRELASDNDHPSPVFGSPSQLSIGGVVELACIRSVCPSWLRTQLDQWAKSCPVLDKAILCYESGKLPSTVDMWASRGLEFFPIRGQNWAADRNYHPFESRFRKAAKEAGFGNKADGLTGALFEMADNVAQHSGSNCSCPAPGLIGYYVCDGHVAFAIGDLGRGVLASLKENPAWTALPNSKAALMAVITNYASRRPHGGEGEGFKEVFRSLTNLNGMVELRSHDGRVKVVQVPAGREAAPQFTGALPGLQLSVNCSLKGPPGERCFSG